MTGLARRGGLVGRPFEGRLTCPHAHHPSVPPHRSPFPTGFRFDDASPGRRADARIDQPLKAGFARPPHTQVPRGTTEDRGGEARDHPLLCICAGQVAFSRRLREYVGEITRLDWRTGWAFGFGRAAVCGTLRGSGLSLAGRGWAAPARRDAPFGRLGGRAGRVEWRGLSGGDSWECECPTMALSRDTGDCPQVGSNARRAHKSHPDNHLASLPVVCCCFVQEEQQAHEPGGLRWYCMPGSTCIPTTM